MGLEWKWPWTSQLIDSMNRQLLWKLWIETSKPAKQMQIKPFINNKLMMNVKHVHSTLKTQPSWFSITSLRSLGILLLWRAWETPAYLWEQQMCRLPEDPVWTLAGFGPVTGLVFLVGFGQFLRSCYRAAWQAEETERYVKGVTFAKRICDKSQVYIKKKHRHSVY